VTNAKEHVKKAQNALQAMTAGGGKNNAAAANQVTGNITLAMNALAGANSTGKADKKAAKKMKDAMAMMGAMMNAGNAVANNCTGA